MDLSSVSYAELEAELKRRNAISKPSSDNDDVMTPIVETTKVNKEVVQEELEKSKEEKLQELKAELEFQQLKNQVLEHQLKVESDMKEMEDNSLDNQEWFHNFNAECDRRMRATSTTEQLSIFPWNRH